ncbi:MAG: amino acid permease [Candidatus Diapherotrites archaeon]|nr:amino acid permease [Candidatus Diapherotrites archaeon]
MALARELGLFTTTMAGIGVILGAGIYALIGEAIAISGPGAWMSFLFAGIVAAFSAMSYAELSSVYPKAGGGYTYAREELGEKIGFLTGWALLFGIMLSSATVSIGFSNYLNAFLNIPPTIGALIIVAMSCGILLSGIRESGKVAVVSTIIELSGLLIIIFIGLPHISSVNLFEMHSGFSGVITGAAIIFFSYLGFEDLVKLAEEVKNPKKNMPRAIILSLILVGIIYILVAIAAVSAMPWQTVGASGAPLSDIVVSSFGPDSLAVISIIALFATGNTVLLMLLAGSRLVYSMAVDKEIFSVFATVNRHKTPSIAIIAICGITAVMTLVGNIGFAASMTNFTLFVSFILVNLSLIMFRRRNKNHKGFRAPLNMGNFPLVGLFGILTSAAFIFFLDLTAILTGSILFALGLLAFYVKESWKKK